MSNFFVTTNLNDALDSGNPVHNINDYEFDNILSSFATYAYLLFGKHMTPTTLFLLILTNIPFRQLLMDMSGFSNQIMLY